MAIEILICSRSLRSYESMRLAVFNSLDYDMRLGREAVKKKYGEKGWAKVKKTIKTGIMGVFNHAPTRETALFVNVVGRSADRRAQREQ